ncbi:MAG: hypothetical protein Roseis2KO_23850 [Roseivirga sp.]
MDSMIRKLLVIALFVGFTACSSRIAQNTVVPVSLIHPKKNQLLFLSLELTKTETGISFSLLDKKLVDGKLKRPLPETLGRPNHLVFEFQNQNGSTLTQVATENPLSRYVEVSDENGKLQRQQINLEKASLVLRIQFNKNMTNLKVTRSTGELLSVLPLEL